ncbi:MAG: helical backbone metal receptor [Steroidobacteraceae bacterium]
MSTSRFVTWLSLAVIGALSFRESAAAGLVVTDDTGATVRLASPAQRIVSLAPGATEMLFAAGAGSRIVATVVGADEPAAARAIVRIGDANALQYERLKALKPDVVVAWKDMTNTLVIESLAKLNLTIYYVSVRTLEDIPRSVRRLGVLAGTGPVAESAARDLERRIATLPTARSSLAAAARAGLSAEPLPVFYMIWDVPLYTVGGRNVMADAIARCGGRNLYDDIDFPAPIVEFEDIKKRDPALILMAAPPITARDWRERWNRFPTVSAVKNRQLKSFSDPRLTRQGPSAIDAVPALCRVIAEARTTPLLLREGPSR